MLRYLLKRLLLFVPMLLIISFIAFGMNQCTPGDPVEAALEKAGVPATAYAREYRQKAIALGLHRPVFYSTLTSLAYPDTLHQITPERRRETASKLIAQYGNWPAIADYLQQAAQLKKSLSAIEDTAAAPALRTAMIALEQLPQAYEKAAVQSALDSISMALSAPAIRALPENPAAQFVAVKQAFQQLESTASRWKLYVPVVYWHGFDNQYHQWLAAIARGDFGVSLQDGRPVSSKIKDAMKWTVTLNLSAIFLAYIFSIPLGVYTATRRGSKADRGISMALFALNSMPSFWVASLLILFFTSPEYGMNFFRVLGPYSLSADASFGERLGSSVTALLLPVFCLTYGSLAFIARQVRAGMVSALEQDYIRTARAKGLGGRLVIWKHAFRNALFPLITLFASILPSALAGSVVIENLFNIPGMGQLMIKSIGNDDWPVIYTILMLASLLTMAGILVADLLYAVADPRVDLNKRNRN